MDDKLIQTIDKLYFEKPFNFGHLLNELPANLTSACLLDYRSRLEKLLNIVTRKVSELILSHQPTYVDELQKIADLQKSISRSIEICSQGRSYLKFVKSSAVIVENYRRRESLAQLLDSLNAINDLRIAVTDIRKLMDSREDFPFCILRAIQKCKDGNAMLASFQDFKCVQELGSKISIDCINAQALNFFKAYHKSSMDELKMFLENELWEMVPVKSDFKLVQLKEFSFLRFEAAKYDSDDESELELSKDFVDEDKFTNELKPTSESSYLPGPVLTNSSLNVLRLIGRYIQMMSVLEPISYEILMRIYNLLDHYTTVVYKKFGPHVDDKNTSAKLENVIRSIRESLIGGQTAYEQQSPFLSSIITNDLRLGESFKSGQNENIDSRKAVAVESLIYLVNQLWNLQEYLESLIPANLRPQLKAQFTQSQSIVPDFLKARAEINLNTPISSY